MQADRNDSTYTVLVVEDDALFRSLLLKTIEDAGYRAEGMGTGEAAIERVRRCTDVMMLLDQQLPDMCGHDVITSLAAGGVHVPFVVVTGQGDEQLAVDMMKFGAADYLIKDDKLLQVLPGVIERVWHGWETERMLHRAELALKENEARFRTLFRDIPSVAVQGYDAAGIIRFWNKASAVLYGYTEAEALGRDIFELLVPASIREAVRLEASRMLDTGTPMPPCEFSLQGKDGRTVVVLTSHAVLRIPGKPTELFSLDVDLTPRRAAEEERESLRAQLVQAQRMESIGRLAGGIAHDFNNMLGVISGNADLSMLHVSSENALAHECLGEIQKATMRAADLTRQLMTFARKQAIAPARLDLNDVIEGMLKILQFMVGKHVEIVWQPASDIGPIFMDPSQIDQIMANLCVNARDAIQDAGRIVIATARERVQASRPGFPGAQPGDYVVVSVCDNGPGMTQAILDNMYDPFFTTKPVDKGTGLGLTTVYGIVQQNNGFIDVQTAVGEGTTFRIYFPSCPEDAAEAPVQPHAWAENEL